MNEALQHISSEIQKLENNLKTVIFGQDELIKNLIITIFSGGHALLEGTPWLGKTRTIRALAESFSLDNKRISFTPDLLPSDLIGAEIFRPNSLNFEIRKWPIFTNILLADEINRTPPKVQSALLEAMEERQVTIGIETIQLPKPFFVFATQNPLENEWTYPLPEAQLDRFFMKIPLHFPDFESEKNILQKNNLQNPPLEKVFSWQEILEIQNFLQKTIRVDEKIYDYVLRILNTYRELTQQDLYFSTHEPLLTYWPSTRAWISLIRGAKVRAVLEGRDYVLPEDIKSCAHEIINHRIGLSYFAISENFSPKQITEKILDSVKILD